MSNSVLEVGKLSKGYSVLGKVLVKLGEDAFYVVSIRGHEITLQGHYSSKLVREIVLAYGEASEVGDINGYVEFNTIKVDGMSVVITLT